MPIGHLKPAHRAKVGRTATAAALASGLLLSGGVTHAAADAGGAEAPAKATSVPASGESFPGASPHPGEAETLAEKSPNDLRVATLHADLVAEGDEEASSEQLLSDLATGTHSQARMLAGTVQVNDPDVLVLTGVSYDDDELIAETLRDQYFASGQGGLEGVEYPHVFTAETNSGKESGADLDGDGSIGGPSDGIGYGNYPGEYGMIVFSKQPIVDEDVRTFRDFLWEDLPESSMPEELSELASSVLRLQESSFWDVPIEVEGQADPVHVLATSTTSPESGERESARAEDIRRVITDYASGEADYLIDDSGESGGLEPGAPLVFAGAPVAADDDANEDLNTLLESAAFQDPEPEALTEEHITERPGSVDQSDETDTRYVPEATDMRASLVLPGAGVDASSSGVFWPGEDEYGYPLVDPSVEYAINDRLVWTDLTLDD